MGGDKPGKAVPEDSSEKTGTEIRDWTEGFVPPLDSPDIRKRVGAIIGEQATRTRRRRAWREEK
jgi:hypothetical protein